MTVLERQPLHVKDLDRSPFSRSDSPGSSYHAYRSDRRSQSRASSRAPRPCSKRVGVASSEPSQSESALLPGGAPDQSHPRGREAGRRNCRARAGVVQAGRRLCTARGVSAGERAGALALLPRGRPRGSAGWGSGDLPLLRLSAVERRLWMS